MRRERGWVAPIRMVFFFTGPTESPTFAESLCPSRPAPDPGAIAGAEAASSVPTKNVMTLLCMLIHLDRKWYRVLGFGYRVRPPHEFRVIPRGGRAPAHRCTGPRGRPSMWCSVCLRKPHDNWRLLGTSKKGPYLSLPVNLASGLSLVV